MPGAFPLVSTFASLQENAFRNVSTFDIDPSLRKGEVTKLAEWVKSKTLTINGEITRWRILGKYDLVAENEDGTIALIDCKVSDSPRDSGDFYSPQLEAYAYALENPAAGKSLEVASMGLLVWNPNKVVGESSTNYAFGVSQKYIPVARDKDKFLTLLTTFISILEGPLPDAGENCATCTYLVQRLNLD